MPKGTIKKLMDRGFGFISTGDEKDLFFHGNDVEGVGFNDLSEGQEVEFEESSGRDGRPAAVKVRPVQSQVEDTGGDSGNDQDVEARTRSRHRITHIQGFITLNPQQQNTASSQENRT